jgi:hypothetical protein
VFVWTFNSGYSAFDIGIACPLKRNFNDEPFKRIGRLIKASLQKREKAAILRDFMIESFLDAWSTAATPGICAQSLPAICHARTPCGLRASSTKSFQREFRVSDGHKPPGFSGYAFHRETLVAE